MLYSSFNSIKPRLRSLINTYKLLSFVWRSENAIPYDCVDKQLGSDSGFDFIKKTREINRSSQSPFQRKGPKKKRTSKQQYNSITQCAQFAQNAKARERKYKQTTTGTLVKIIT